VTPLTAAQIISADEVSEGTFSVGGKEIGMVSSTCSTGGLGYINNCQIGLASKTLYLTEGKERVWLSVSTVRCVYYQCLL